MSDPKKLDFCYDFPRLVLHRPSCVRYKGGICHPLPTPVEPYTADAASAVKAYSELVEGIDEDLAGRELARVTAARVGGKVFTAPGLTVAPIGVTPDPRVQELLDMGVDYDEALRICADPRYGGVLTIEKLVGMLLDEEREERRPRN